MIAGHGAARGAHGAKVVPRPSTAALDYPGTLCISQGRHFRAVFTVKDVVTKCGVKRTAKVGLDAEQDGVDDWLRNNLTGMGAAGEGQQLSTKYTLGETFEAGAAV